MRIGLLSMLLFVQLGCVGRVYAADPNEYLGRWRIAEIADFAQVAAIDDIAAKKKIGSGLVILAHSLRFGPYSCKPRYSVSIVDPDKDLQAGYRIGNEALKLPNPVVVIDTGCQRSHYIYVVNRNQIILEHSGVFYRAWRIRQ